ncbi:MAG: type II secretion system protein GspG [Opitutaceae bacterium]
MISRYRAILTVNYCLCIVSVGAYLLSRPRYTICTTEGVAESFVWNTSKIGLQPYKLDMGEFPSSVEGLQALTSAPERHKERWRGPYLDEIPLDPWGNPYQYRFPSKHSAGSYDVWSFGVDGVESNDDICSWKKPST